MLDANARLMIEAAQAVLDVRTVKAEVAGRPGSIQVLRVIKGNFRRGQIVAAVPAGSAACGPDTIMPGRRGILLVDRPSLPLRLGSFVAADLEESMRRQGLLREVPKEELLSEKEEKRLSEVRERQERDQDARAPEAAFQAEGHKVHERVRLDPNFGGFIFRSGLWPHAVVMFTGDNVEARLGRYTRDPRFKAQRVDLTLVQLERMKDQVGERLHRLGVPCLTVDADEEHNMITVRVPDPARVQRAIADRRLNLPPKVRFLRGSCPEFR
jgi:hypothetical protein